MQSIETKFIAPSNVKGSRVKAWNNQKSKSLTLDYQHGLNYEANMQNVAFMLATKLGWKGEFVGGHTSQGMVFVIRSEKDSPFNHDFII